MKRKQATLELARVFQCNVCKEMFTEYPEALMHCEHVTVFYKSPYCDHVHTERLDAAVCCARGDVAKQLRLLPEREGEELWRLTLHA